MKNFDPIGDEISYLSVFSSNFSFLLSIIVGVIATYFVFRTAKKMGGGLFGTVLNYIGFGMVLIILGSILIALESLDFGFWTEFTYTLFFSLGFIFMAIGANKLLKGLNNY